jgi:hypothetical protein
VGDRCECVLQLGVRLFWYFLARNPVLMIHAKGPAPVWDSTTLNILGGEFVLIVVSLGLIYFLQSRKHDFAERPFFDAAPGEKHERKCNAIRVSSCSDAVFSVGAGWRGNLQRTLCILP